jgi:Cu-processing system ATP-binding protein
MFAKALHGLESATARRPPSGLVLEGACVGAASSMRRFELRDVTVHFGKLAALEGFALELDAGRVALLAGPNGAGKSTLIRVLLGLVRPDRGSLLLDGREVRVDSALKTRLGYLPESVAFADALTGREVVAFFAQARGVARSRVAAALARVGLSGAANRAVRGYSRGMRQRLGLAVAILHEPELLVLDEPTGGLDQDGLTVLWSVLDEWRAGGRIVLLASHEIALLETRVDDVCLLSQGRVVARGNPHDLRASVALPLRVRVATAREASGVRVLGYIEAVKAIEGGAVLETGGGIEVVVPPSQLLSLLELNARHPGLVRDLRVQEPPFDEVYRALLRSSESAALESAVLESAGSGPPVGGER